VSRATITPALPPAGFPGPVPEPPSPKTASMVASWANRSTRDPRLPREPPLAPLTLMVPVVSPLPAPGSQEKRAPLPWDPAAPYRGLGFREIDASPREPSYALREFPVVRS